jgi:flagellar basal-body rod protein FlgB
MRHERRILQKLGNLECGKKCRQPAARIADFPLLPVRRSRIKRDASQAIDVAAIGMEIAMLSSLFQSTTIPVLEQVVNFTEARHGVLAGNIANLDTPGYRTRDLSPALFQERLKEAIEARQQPPTSRYESNTYSLSAAPAPSHRREHEMHSFRKVEDSMKSILRHDDGDVSMERQINAIVKNQQQHNLAVNIISAQFRLLRAAITERVA